MGRFFQLESGVATRHSRQVWFCATVVWVALLMAAGCSEEFDPPTGSAGSGAGSGAGAGSDAAGGSGHLVVMATGIEQFEGGTLAYDLGAVPGAEVIVDHDPIFEGDPPDLWDRESFYFVRGMYEQVDGERRLVGIWFDLWNWFDGESHHAEWEPGLIALDFLEGDYYCHPEWYLRTEWSGSPGLWGISIGYWFDPAMHRLRYIHVFAEYYEDDDFIRYVDRTLVEDWGVGGGGLVIESHPVEPHQGGIQDGGGGGHTLPLE